MKEERTTPLRARMIEDMRIRGMGDKAQEAHIRAIKDFAGFLRRSPDLATPDDLRVYQLHMTNAGVSPWMFNSRIVALRFFFGVTLNLVHIIPISAVWAGPARNDHLDGPRCSMRRPKARRRSAFRLMSAMSDTRWSSAPPVRASRYSWR